MQLSSLLFYLFFMYSSKVFPSLSCSFSLQQPFANSFPFQCLETTTYSQSGQSAFFHTILVTEHRSPPPASLCLFHKCAQVRVNLPATLLPCMQPILSFSQVQPQLFTKEVFLILATLLQGDISDCAIFSTYLREMSKSPIFANFLKIKNIDITCTFIFTAFVHSLTENTASSLWAV